MIKSTNSLVKMLLLLWVVYFLSACVAVPYPRAHSVAYDYYYYPNLHLYYDINRQVYHYRNSNHWHSSTHLPPSISIHSHHRVKVTLNGTKPYYYFDSHRHKYPKKQYKRRHHNHGYKDAHRYRDHKPYTEQHAKKRKRPYKKPGGGDYKAGHAKKHKNSQYRKNQGNYRNSRNKKHAKKKGKHGESFRQKKSYYEKRSRHNHNSGERKY